MLCRLDAVILIDSHLRYRCTETYRLSHLLNCTNNTSNVPGCFEEMQKNISMMLAISQQHYIICISICLLFFCNLKGILLSYVLLLRFFY